MRKGFTLSEVMIALTVLGVLCVTVLPAIVSTMPSQKKIMIKRAYYTTANLVSDLINDPDLYPSVNTAGVETVGFDNTDTVTFRGETYGGATKFQELFAAQLNIDGDITTGCNGESLTNCRTFKTADGILWTIGTSGTDYVIYVDVNADKEPNCRQGDTTADDDCKNREKDFDKFSMTVKTDGGIEIPDEQPWVKEALQVSSPLVDRD